MEKGRRQNSVTEVKTYLKDGSFPDDLTKNQKGAFRRYTKRFRLNDGVLKYKSKHYGEDVYLTVVMNEEEKLKVLEGVHTKGGHMGRNNTEFKISRHFYWLGIRSDVEKYLAECQTCKDYSNGVGTPLTVPRAKVPRVKSAQTRINNKKVKAGFCKPLVVEVPKWPSKDSQDWERRFSEWLTTIDPKV